MHVSTIIFDAFAVLLVLSAIVVVTSRNVFHSAIALTAALALVAGIFLMLGADFIGASQLLVYVGGIMIIMLFVIMLSQQPLESRQRQTNEQWLGGLGIGLVIMAVLVM